MVENLAQIGTPNAHETQGSAHMIIPAPLHAKMYGLSEEQAMLRETVHEYVDDKVIPSREALDREGVYPRAIHEDMLEMGILAMCIPEDCDGLGMGAVEAAVVYEELSRGCAGMATALGANSLGTDPILLYGTDEQRKKYLSKVAAGAIAAYALTEPNAGTDVGGIATVAVPDPGGETWKLKGQKTFITNAGVASIYTIFALTDPTRGPRGASCFIAEIDADNPPPGIEFPEKFDKMGINASETREIIFDGFEVRTEDIIGGKPGRGFLQAMSVFDVSRPMVGSMGVGVGQSAFEAALTYAHQRVQFGKPIIHLAGLRNMFIDMWLAIEGARAMVMVGARKADRKFHLGFKKEDVTAWSAMAKFMGSEAARVSLTALQATGGYGYMNETPFPKMVRDHKVLEIYEGTNQIQREQAGRQLMQEFQKNGTAIPGGAEDSFAAGAAAGGRAVALAWKVTDQTLDQVLKSNEGETALNSRQEVHWILGEMGGLAESARFLAEACSRAAEDAGEGHWISALGEAYARESALEVANRAERILRGEDVEAHAAVAELLEECRACANGLFGYRDRLGQALLEVQV